MVLDGLLGLYGLKYDSTTAYGLPLYLCSYKLVGSATENPILAIFMNCDNQTVIIKVNSSRHVKRQLKSVRKLRNSRVIALDYVHTSKNLADQFTKGLSHNVIGTKWVYRNKQDQDGIVVRNKARLVAQGYTQVEGLDWRNKCPSC